MSKNKKIKKEAKKLVKKFGIKNDKQQKIKVVI